MLTRFAVVFASLCSMALIPAGAADKPAEEQIAGPGGLKVTVRMQGPYDAEVPLQIVCYFKHKAGQTLKGAPVELDKRLSGVIGNLRSRGEFVGEALETLVIDTRQMIPAKKLLLIGLGSEADLSLDVMERVGRVAYREAARLKATSVAFAPLLRDQGVDTLPTGDVEQRVIRGVLLARDTDTRLQHEGLGAKFELQEWIVEAGPAFFQETTKGVNAGIKDAASAVKARNSSPFITPP